MQVIRHVARREHVRQRRAAVRIDEYALLIAALVVRLDAKSWEHDWP